MRQNETETLKLRMEGRDRDEGIEEKKETNEK